MDKKTEKKIKEKIAKLVEHRNALAKMGSVWGVQQVNQMLAVVARKLKVDYDSL